MEADSDNLFHRDLIRQQSLNYFCFHIHEFVFHRTKSIRFYFFISQIIACTYCKVYLRPVELSQLIKKLKFFIIFINGGILSLTDSHHHHHGQIPTMVSISLQLLEHRWQGGKFDTLGKMGSTHQAQRQHPQ